tara:strand:- start:245 stop:1408 length:1164 start_codon:yes stop_codon:yes gene_type:complete
MIIKLKNEYIKRCLNQNRLSLYKIINIYFVISFFFYINILNANECGSTSPIKVGLIENNHIDYKYYLYYELGNYAAEKDLEFEINIIENNVDQFDIIFGEYNDLAKLSSNNIIYPEKIQEFYSKNNINTSNNIFPLDLDTFIIVSKDNQKKINTLEDLSKFYDPIRYTLGISFDSSMETSKLLSYISSNKDFNLKDMENESILTVLNKAYKNFNKNILSSDYLEIYNSYENKENIYTLFSDGVLLNKNFEYQFYQLFPQSKYKWESNEGVFIKNKDVTSYSYYGFSAYLNNTNQFGFLCHLLDYKVRKNSFKNFNISLSPLSVKEVEDFDQLPKDYLEILESKNKNIININYVDFLSDYKLIKEIIFGNQKYDNSVETNDYLTRNLN